MGGSYRGFPGKVRCKSFLSLTGRSLVRKDGGGEEGNGTVGEVSPQAERKKKNSGRVILSKPPRRRG